MHNGTHMGLGNIMKLSNAQSRSIEDAFMRSGVGQLSTADDPWRLPGVLGLAGTRRPAS
jgi:hypothetical protein